MLASGHLRPHKQAAHMIASDPIRTLPKLYGPAEYILAAGGRRRWRQFWSGVGLPAGRGLWLLVLAAAVATTLL